MKKIFYSLILTLVTLKITAEEIKLPPTLEDCDVLVDEKFIDSGEGLLCDVRKNINISNQTTFSEQSGGLSPREVLLLTPQGIAINPDRIPKVRTPFNFFLKKIKFEGLMVAHLLVSPNAFKQDAGVVLGFSTISHWTLRTSLTDFPTKPKLKLYGVCTFPDAGRVPPITSVSDLPLSKSESTVLITLVIDSNLDAACFLNSQSIWNGSSRESMNSMTDEIKDEIKLPRSLIIQVLPPVPSAIEPDAFLIKAVRLEYYPNKKVGDYKIVP